MSSTWDHQFRHKVGLSEGAYTLISLAVFDSIVAVTAMRPPGAMRTESCWSCTRCEQQEEMTATPAEAQSSPDQMESGQ